MSEVSADGVTFEPSLSDIKLSLDQLQDLFRRRLLEDREKQRSFDALYEELRAARATASGEAYMPLIRALLPVIDRLDTAGTEFASSIAEELLSVLRLHGVDEVIETSAKFDASCQEVVSSVPVDQPELHGKVIQVSRRGFRRADQVLRPSLVAVGVYQATEPE